MFTNLSNQRKRKINEFSDKCDLNADSVAKDKRRARKRK